MSFLLLGSRGSGGGGRGGYSDGGDCETIFVESSEVGRIIGKLAARKNTLPFFILYVIVCASVCFVVFTEFKKAV